MAGEKPTKPQDLCCAAPAGGEGDLPCGKFLPSMKPCPARDATARGCSPRAGQMPLPVKAPARPLQGQPWGAQPLGLLSSAILAHGLGLPGCSTWLQDCWDSLRCFCCSCLGLSPCRLFVPMPPTGDKLDTTV